MASVSYKKHSCNQTIKEKKIIINATELYTIYIKEWKRLQEVGQILNKKKQSYIHKTYPSSLNFK